MSTSSPDEQAAAQQVAQAGAQAAANAPPDEVQAAASKAMKRERDRVKIEIPDEEIERIAARLNELNLQGFADRGAFDSPPEPVKAPDNAVGPPPTEQQAPPGGESAPEPPPAKRTFAHRFMGIR